MATIIHPTAHIEKGAELDETVRVGPYAFIGAGVRIGRETIIHHHATVEGNTEVGVANQVFPYAYIGAQTHDLKFRGGKPGLKIGDNNTFREYVSVHLATDDGQVTVIGDHNVILAYSHVAHDCRVGSHLIMSSHAALGGHVEVGDYVNVGWGVGVHQFCRLGNHSMVGAASKLVQDVPPFMIADGNPAVVRTINKVGLERRGIETTDIERIRAIYKLLYRSGLNRTQAIEALRQSATANHWAAQAVVDFIKNSNRGFA